MSLNTRTLFALMLIVATVGAQIPSIPPVPPTPLPTPTYPGQVIPPGGGGIANCTFIYDGGNLTGGVILDYNCAIGAGLGTGGPGGTFVPPAGTACIPVNNELMWCFGCITVLANDINGTPCFCKSNVYVAKDPNSAFNKNILSRYWGQCVGASDDAVGGATWGGTTAVGPRQLAAASLGNRVATVRQLYDVDISGSTPSNAIGAQVQILTTAGYSFIPQSIATSLGLTSTLSIDVSATDPDSLEALDRSGLRQDGQTSFPVVWVPHLAFQIGAPLSGHMLVINDANSDHIILGGRGNPFTVGFVIESHNPRDTLVCGSMPAPAPVPWTSFDVTPAHATPGGGFVLQPILPGEGFVEGWTLFSTDTAATTGPFGFGPLVGLYPDVHTWMSLSPASPGNIFHFLEAPGQYPYVPLTLPSGSLAPLLEFDVAMAYVAPGGAIKATSATRVTVH